MELEKNLDRFFSNLPLCAFPTYRFPLCGTGLWFLQSQHHTSTVKFEYVHEGEEITRFHKVKKKRIFSTGPYEIWVKNSDPRISYLTGQSCLE